MIGSKSAASAFGVSSSSSGIELLVSGMFPSILLPVSSLPRSSFVDRMGRVVVGNASSAGFLITRFLEGLDEAPAGDPGRVMPNAKEELNAGATGMDFARDIGGAVREAEWDCERMWPREKGEVVRGGRERGCRVVSQGRPGRAGSVTRRMQSGFGDGLEKFGI